MPSSVGSRPQMERTPTWPPSTRLAMDGPKAPESDFGSMSPLTERKPDDDTFEDLDDHPEDHFLSPMQYEDWASDSDDDGEEIEWDAGITDFALFDSDRRRAQETDEQMDARWDDFLAAQRSVLQRTVERKQLQATINTTRPPLPAEDVPGLTPDTSPNLRDDLDMESDHVQSAFRPSVPSYLTVTVTPPSPEDRMIEDEDDLPLSFSLNRGKQRKPTARKVQRPGLRHARTLSGKVHVWRRPSWNIYPVGEDPDAERRAEQGMIRRMDGQEDLRSTRLGEDG